MSLFSPIKRSEGDPEIVRSGPSSITSTERLAKGLGWFSIGLGVVQLIAAGRLTEALGMDGREGLMRAYGAREIASGVLTLSTEKKIGLWSRVGGDGLDIATLMSGLERGNPKNGNVALALTMVMGVTLLDFIAAQAATLEGRRKGGERRLYRDRSGFPNGVQAARKMADRGTIPNGARGTSNGKRATSRYPAAQYDQKGSA